MSTLCPPCATQRQAWLDHQGPLEHGIKLAQSGPDSGNQPSWTRTHRRLVATLEALEVHCATNHGRAAS